MSVNEEYAENRFSILIAKVEGDERDRMWQRTSDVLDCSSASSYYSKSQDILPLRPGVSKYNQKTTRLSAPISNQHKERGLHRPDEWVGELKKKNRKSWRVKAVRDVNLDDTTHAQSVQSLPVDFGRREPLLFSKPDSKQDKKSAVPAVVLPPKPKTLDSSSTHSILTEDSMWSQVSESDWIQERKETKYPTSSLVGGTDKLSNDITSDKKDLDSCASSLLSDSSIHSSDTREPMKKWQSRSAVNSNFSFLDSRPEKPKTRPKWKPKPARTLPTTDVQKAKESTPAPTKSSARPLPTHDDTYCLPDLEMSSLGSESTLGFLSKSSSSFRWKNKKHWQSMAGSRRYQPASSRIYQTDEDKESERRRSAIRDSLFKAAFDVMDAPDVF